MTPPLLLLCFVQQPPTVTVVLRSMKVDSTRKRLGSCIRFAEGGLTYALVHKSFGHVLRYLEDRAEQVNTAVDFRYDRYLHMHWFKPKPPYKTGPYGHNIILILISSFYIL